ncbi:MAG: bifunctional ADP-dependent NAD(P)H-hydrate dehydratase/NAD(P)H-hydrate epimerase [Treponemataceae bacterium]
MIAVSCAAARSIDAATSAEYGISEVDLVKKAGSLIAEKLRAFLKSPIVLLAGAGNNAADAMCAADCLLRGHFWKPDELTVVLRSEKEKETLVSVQMNVSPFGQHLRALAEKGISILVWDGVKGEAARLITESALIIDGLTGTGLKGTPRGVIAEMITFVNALRHDGRERRVVAIDMPSGLSDDALDRSLILHANVTVAVEPIKECLYRPFSRTLAGRIIPVFGIFPSALLNERSYTNIFDFPSAALRIPPVPQDAYKHRRGTVEIHAGSVGATGAAKLAVRGAAAAGAGLIRVIADADTWPILAASESGAMVKNGEQNHGDSAPADTYVIGPGWGVSDDRRKTLRRLLDTDASFVLDADAIRMLASTERDMPKLFSGKVIITPHPGEFSIFAGCPKNETDINPDPILLKTAAERNVVILFKGHVMRVAAPDGRIAYIDGVEPILAVGGSGDVLTGLTAGIAARTYKMAVESNTAYDPFPVAVAAAALLIEAGKKAHLERGFCDPSEFAFFAGKIACDAWIKDT